MMRRMRRSGTVVAGALLVALVVALSCKGSGGRAGFAFDAGDDGSDDDGGGGDDDAGSSSDGGPRVDARPRADARPVADAAPAPYCTPSAGTNLRLVPIVSGLDLPVYLTAPAADRRLFVLEQAGRIRVVKDGAVLGTPFLDLESLSLPAADRLNNAGEERGLLGLAFHPDYASNGRFYVHYTAAANIIVAEYTADPASDVARTTGRVVLRVPHNRDGHNGGTVQFGPDGYLYISIGDNTDGVNGQSLTTMLGKLLRIDVDETPYAIPADNPFTTGAREVFAYGLRNPYRFSIDGQTGNIFIGDVGFAKWEEIDVIPGGDRGLNFGWQRCEGAEVYDDSDPEDDNGAPNGPCNLAGAVNPVFAYDQRDSTDPDNPCAVIGGAVYRGTCVPALAGHYVFGDLCTGKVKSFVYTEGQTPNVVDRSTDLDVDRLLYQNLSGFGVDGFGELYVIALGRSAPVTSGTVYRIEVQP
jgi:hypothetical protein